MGGGLTELLVAVAGEGGRWRGRASPVECAAGVRALFGKGVSCSVMALNC